MAKPNPNKALVRRYFNGIMNNADAETAHEILADDYVFTLPTHPEPYRGPDGMLELVNMLHSAFPDFYIHPADMVAYDDTVVTRWRGGGTHKGGPLVTVSGDLEANGEFFEIDGMTWHTIKNGKIVEAIGHEDTIGLMMQLGVIPSEDGGENPDHDAENNERLVNAYFNDIMSQGNLDMVEEVLAPNFAFIIPTQPAPIAGYDNFKGFVMYLRNAFPDIKFTVLRQGVEGNKVASRWKITGTHEGEFLGAPPTGNSIEDYGIDIFTIRNGKIESVHVNENDFGLMQQLGVIPS